MVDTRNMVLKRNTWFAKLGIPKEVRHVFKGKTAFVKTTGESDPHRAYRVAARMLAQWRDEIDWARSNIPSGLMEEWIGHARRWCELFPNIPYDLPDDPNDERPPVAWLVGFINYVRAEVYDLLAFRTMPQIEQQQQAWHGEPSVLTSEWADKQLAKAGVSTPFLHHLVHFEKNTALVGGTLRQTLSTIRKFAEAVPQTIEQLNGMHVQQWLHDLRNEKHPEKPADRGTKVRKLYELRQYWKHLVAMGHVPEDKACPFDNRIVSNRETEADAQERERVAFKPAEMPRLWKQAEANDDPSLAAVIKLAAHSGARLGEIMNLKRDHIFAEEDSDIPCIHIMRGKRCKSKRWFPVHPDIQDLVTSLMDRADKDGYLIHSTAQHRSAAMSQRFSRMKTAMGYGRLYVEHCIRHSVIQMFREIRCPLEVRNMMLGHEDGDGKTGSGADYGDLSPAGRLRYMRAAIGYAD